MQLKPLHKGRFQDHWQDNHSLIEQVVLSCISEEKIIEEKSPLMSQGQQLNYLTLVRSGKVSIGYTAQNGRSFQLGTMECDYQVFGEMEFFSSYRCQLDIIAEETLTVAFICADKLQQALVKNPQVALFFASAIAIDYQDTVNILIHRMLYPIAYNVAYDLYQQYLRDFPVDGFTKSYMEAERFGTTDRVYRRAVKELTDLGLVERSKQGLSITDIDALKRYLAL
ncbi:cyclic nucleotide-binding domain-containing protein [Plesiomonas shigelloides]|uniref:Crp/Fnr family transcriptional regulator n=1 Tax=Plesiomonas shigelloides TaxID=703 RepID=UPI001261E3D4|nr:Crp/Fnr family transcriptional regulator [Plesiomonas shigelloides]KAB7691180.1 cyclic nucleotide-binding domain-containing protein [Plesiomonas shigelloides]